MLKASDESSADVIAITAILAAASYDEIVTYQAISTAIGRPIQSCRYLVHRALKHVNDDNGAIFANVSGQGYKRLRPEESAVVGMAARRRIRRAAKRASKVIGNAVARANNLPPADKLKIYSELSALGFIEHAAKNGFAAKIEKSAPQAPLPLAIVSEEFRRHLGIIGTES